MWEDGPLPTAVYSWSTWMFRCGHLSDASFLFFTSMFLACRTSITFMPLTRIVTHITVFYFAKICIIQQIGKIFMSIKAHIIVKKTKTKNLVSQSNSLRERILPLFLKIPHCSFISLSTPWGKHYLTFCIIFQWLFFILHHIHIAINIWLSFRFFLF